MGWAVILAGLGVSVGWSNIGGQYLTPIMISDGGTQWRPKAAIVMVCDGDPYVAIIIVRDGGTYISIIIVRDGGHYTASIICLGWRPLF
jgi:hypothetical protein